MTEPAPLAVYVHWPYCARICPYCDFNVLRDRGQAEQAALAGAIVADLEGQAARIGPRRLSSVFLGGGTPSLMRPEWAAAIIGTARRLWPPSAAVEVALEANPTDAEAGRFAAFRAAGVERLSLGVQSLNDEALKFLGRNHDAAAARRALETALGVFPRVSLDLIYALPGQTEAAWRAELSEAARLGAGHISPYQLTIEQGTAFDRRARRGEITPPDADLAAALYETTQAVLEEAGLHAYEVSNHARDGAQRSAHNLAYWRGWDYVGAGPGAHGRLTIGGVRHATRAAVRPGEYIEAVQGTGTGIAEEEALSPYEAAVERLLMGLRTSEGVPLADIAPLGIGTRELERAEGLAIVEDGRLFATMRGRAVLDHLTRTLIP